MPRDHQDKVVEARQMVSAEEEIVHFMEDVTSVMRQLRQKDKKSSEWWNERIMDINYKKMKTYKGRK